MSRAGEEMMAELYGLLNRQGIIAKAALPEDIDPKSFRPMMSVPVEKPMDISDEQLAQLGITREQLGQSAELYPEPEGMEEMTESLRPIYEEQKEEMSGIESGPGRLSEEELGKYVTEFDALVEKIEEQYDDLKSEEVLKVSMKAMIDFIKERGINISDFQRIALRSSKNASALSVGLIKKISIINVIGGLVRSAGILDELGEHKASNAVDYALQTIVSNLKRS